VIAAAKAITKMSMDASVLTGSKRFSLPAKNRQTGGGTDAADR